ncbi:restriction endonuclease subunit S [Myroides odoratimimus]|uniref:restriction endonuclease subunit S n=2 Tax=Myroides odoratimimus TaxID=76832 RepID=UPI001CE1C897|nr:restriction endonuclease subunit S [Myroides odoratimimus]MCA4792689.1 restriction endonuclease subunit S [Myroides odoratimimus]MCA4819869.1 restriction endonuclease subunit S [Myroides odoratimimus]MDM1401240.1 restriction endonuclease subunit S [Myroides odoratimimus]MDM1457210.1 restriction endonuclease subunit S [Myroides odoratimimus]
MNKNKIPEGWKVKSLGEIGSVFSGGTPDTSELTFWDGDILWCTPSEITALKGNKYIETTERKITQEGLKKSSAILLPALSLIVCTRATIGAMAINKVPMCTNQGFKSIIPQKGVSVTFLYYLLSTKKDLLLKHCIGSTFLELSKKDFCGLTIEVPPLREQERIASILSTWDKAIEKQEQLIQEKKTYKQGVMQQLLTGKKRFKEFTDQWQEVKLGDVADIQMGQSPDSKYYNENGEGMFLIQGNADIKNRVSHPRFWTKVTTKECVEGDILMTVRAPVGSIAIAKHNACIGRGVCAIRTRECMSYLFYTLISLELSWKTLEQGSTFSSVNSKDIKELILKLPSLSEQEKIASVLLGIDKEIEILEKELEGLRVQKRGLMQQLLTGKVRV